MKLGVVNNQEFCTDGTKHSTSVSFFEFIESFAEYFEEINVFVPTKQISPDKHAIYPCPKHIKLCPLPYYYNANDLYKRLLKIAPATFRAARKQLKECDVVWLIQPHPIAWLFALLVLKEKKHMFLHIRGDILTDVGIRYSGIKYLMAKSFALVSHVTNQILTRMVPTFVVGKELYELYDLGGKSGQILFNLSPSLIHQELIDQSRQYRTDFIKKREEAVTLIFVGRVEPEKGLTYLFESLKDLNKVADVRLFIVGVAQRGSEEKEAQIRELAKQLGIDNQIVWKGYAQFGERLFSHYRNADIFVLPSLSEGIPKVLYEAMAFGLPIVTTNVGGITDIVTHRQNGLCIPPRSSEAITNAIKELITNRELWRSLVEKGFNVAQKNTMESARDKIFEGVIRPYIYKENIGSNMTHH